MTPGVAIIFAGFGEPFLNPRIEEFVESAHRLGLARDLKILTNFSAISEKRIKDLVALPFSKLIISLDAMSRETYLEYKSCDHFDLVFQNIRILAEEAATRDRLDKELVVQMIVTRKNRHETQRFVDTMKRLGLIPVLKSLNVHHSSPGDEKRQDYQVPEFARKYGGPYSKKCEWVWGGIMVLWNGEVTICCEDGCGKEAYGSVHESNLIHLLNGNERRCDFRRRYFADPGQIDLCRHCHQA